MKNQLSLEFYHLYHNQQREAEYVYLFGAWLYYVKIGRDHLNVHRLVYGEFSLFLLAIAPETNHYVFH